ncbi:MAG: hypothetical protein HC802_23410 [Caldilineaceae bacterium]|nr:hypothetical protein [Caldilineaceae bacterium]
MPVVAVVIATESGQAAIHYRSPGADSWRTLKEGISLSDALSAGDE